MWCPPYPNYLMENGLNIQSFPCFPSCQEGPVCNMHSHITMEMQDAPFPAHEDSLTGFFGRAVFLPRNWHGLCKAERMKPSAKKMRSGIYVRQPGECHVRVVCAWCGTRMSPASPIQPMEVISHGICLQCSERLLADFGSRL
jgi:hypothetical protein